jgi:hypothetical protein
MGFIDTNSIAYEQHTLGVAPVVSLSAQSATSATPTVLDGVVVRQNAVMAVSTSVGVSSGSVQLQGSLTGAANSWFNIGSAVSTTSASTTTTVTSTSAFTRFVKAVIATTISGGTVTVSVGVYG